MSYEISYRRQAFRMPAAHAVHHDDILFLVEEAGSNNCYEIDNRRRSRSWDCLAAGSGYECLAEITCCAAACCGGSLILCGRRHTTPEAYIRAWRRTIAAAVPFEEARRVGFHLRLFTRISDADAKADRKYAFDRLNGQTAIAPQRGKDEFSGAEYTEWRFDATFPEQVKLWLETRSGGRGFHSVDASGPRR